MEITLTDYQRNQLEQALVAKQNAEKIQEELLEMIFSYNKVQRPSTPVNYKDGKLSWTSVVTPVTDELPVE